MQEAAERASYLPCSLCPAGDQETTVSVDDDRAHWGLVRVRVRLRGVAANEIHVSCSHLLVLVSRHLVLHRFYECSVRMLRINAVRPFAARQ